MANMYMYVHSGSTVSFQDRMHMYMLSNMGIGLDYFQLSALQEALLLCSTV